MRGWCCRSREIGSGGGVMAPMKYPRARFPPGRDNRPARMTPGTAMTALPTAAGQLESSLQTRLPGPALAWIAQACAEIEAGTDPGAAPERAISDVRFGSLLSSVSRHVRRESLAPTAGERSAAQQ